jgi:beta-lactam-binding protein with PASTA domain
MPWRRRKVTEEQATPPPPRPLIWPWLALLLLLVLGGIAAAYVLTRDDSGTTTRVPDVVGLGVAEAVRDLGQRGYAADVQERVSSSAPPGEVLAQAPAPGTELDRGSRVTIVVTRGSTTEVPRVVGLSLGEATARLQEAGLKSRTVKIASSRPKDRVIRQSPPAGADAKKGTTVVLTISRGARPVAVPTVKGLTEASATATLDRLGFLVSVSRIPSSRPRGIVISQEPAPGTRAAKGSVVGINVSTGTTTTTTTTTTTKSGTPMPNVVGLSQRDAVARLQRAGLRVDSFPAASSRPRGTVVAQRPPGGTRVPPKSLVRIDVSLGAGERPLRTVPDVIGMTESEAKQALVETGFTVRSVDRPAADLTQKDVVLEQQPTAGERASAGTQILIYVGRVPSSTD